jgi:hypothetical protein
MRIAVKVHIGHFKGDPEPYHFINVWNKYYRRWIKIVRIFYLSENKIYDIKVQPGREFPALIPPTEEWETWIKVNEVTSFPDPNLKWENRFVVELENGKLIASSKRKDVAPFGVPPGNK